MPPRVSAFRSPLLSLVCCHKVRILLPIGMFLGLLRSSPKNRRPEIDRPWAQPRPWESMIPVGAVDTARTAARAEAA